MIDTLHLQIPKFSVVRPGSFRVKKCRAKAGGSDETEQPFLFKAEDGTVVRGEKAYLNKRACQCPFSLEIRRIKRTGIVCAIPQFSAPKLYSRDGINRHTLVTVEEFEESLARLHGQLKKVGFRCDLDDIRSAPLLQVDLFRDIDLHLPYPTYVELLELLDAGSPTMKRRLSHKTTYYWGSNKQERQIVVYWKSKQ